MLVLATICILVGIIFLIFAAFSSQKDQPTYPQRYYREPIEPSYDPYGSYESGWNSPIPRREFASPRPYMAPPSSDYRAPLPKDPPDWEERMIREREIRKPKKLVSSIEPVHPSMVPETSSTTVEFSLDGILFLDHDKQFPFNDPKFQKETFSPEMYSGLKRIGPASLKEENGEFVFTVENSKYFYDPKKIDQILFFDNCTIFVPRESKVSTALFFTKDVALLKEFLRQGSLIGD
jgi:hypothetical protein